MASASPSLPTTTTCPTPAPRRTAATRIDGVAFGWKVGWYDNGTAYLTIEPGNFIAYYAPWDGLDYDT